MRPSIPLRADGRSRVSPPGTEAGTFSCPYASEHPRLTELIEQHEKRLDRMDPKLDGVISAVAEIRGAWKMAVMLGSITGGVVAAAITCLVEWVVKGG